MKRTFIGTLGAAIALVAITAQPGHAAGTRTAEPKLALSALAFEHPDVDVTKDYGSNKLTWTVTNTDPDADSVSGTVTIRSRSTVTGKLLGHDVTVTYGYEDTCCSDGFYESGTPQNSTYSYHLPVRRYSDAATVTWEVTQVSINSGDDTAAISGAALKRLGYRFTARTLIDASGPTIDNMSLGWSRAPYVYVGNGPAEVSYDFTVQDYESGFWKGTIRLAGPAGQSVTTPFTWEREAYSTGVHCGGISGGDRDASYMPCVIPVTIPAGAAPGSWRVASLVLDNNAGGRTTYKNPKAPSITVTSNTTVQASDFAISPNPVDTWRDDVMAELTMSVSGARKGVSAIHVDMNDASCQQWGSTVVKDDGRIAVPIRVSRRTERCTVKGITVVDGAGNAALYGSAFQAPDPKLTITRIPSTDPPTALGAEIDPPSMPASETRGRSLELTIRAKVQTAPIDGLSVYLYDAQGEVVYQSFGGTSQAADGTVSGWVYTPWGGLAPGSYTVGFSLSDAGRLSSYWNMPDHPSSQSLPSGPVVLTVTEG